MTRLTLLGWFLFGALAVAAQEKITNFDNITTKSITTTSYLDTLNNKLLFFAYSPEHGTNLWVSDGTLANTKQLKDSSGTAPQYYYALRSPIKKYGYTYVYQQYLWKTDSEKLIKILPNADSLADFQVFANKLLLFFSHYKYLPDGTSTPSTSFAWLDSTDRITSWEKDINRYMILDGTLHYMKYNRITQLYEIHKIKPDNTHVINVIDSENMTIYDFRYLSRNNHDYYVFWTNVGQKIYHKLPDDERNAVLEPWDSDSGFDNWLSFWIKDTADNIYLIKFLNGLKIYTFNAANEPQVKWELPADAFRGNKDMPYALTNLVGNMSIIGDKLMYINAYAGEGIYAFYLNRLDLNTAAHKRSKSLQYTSGFAYTNNLTITQVNADTYILDDKYGKKLTYNFKLDSVLSITSYKPKDAPDSILVINKQKLLLSDNLYNITTTKTPLIPTRSIFRPDGGELFSYRVLKDKILFWRWNPVIQKSQLWVSNGEKNSAEFLMDVGSYFDYGNGFTGNLVTELNGKVYFVYPENTTTSFIYETDGTRAGTKKIGQTDPIVSIKSNQKYIVFTTSKNELYVIENGQGYLIKNIPPTIYGFDVYVPDNHIYVLTYSATPDNWSYYELFTIENGKVVYLDNYIGYVFAYKDRFFYTKRMSNKDYTVFNLYNVGEGGKITEVGKDVGSAFSQGSKLIYHQGSTDNKSPKTVIINMLTSKTDIVVDNLYVSFFESYNTAFGEVLLLRAESKTVLIKDNKRIDFNTLTLPNGFANFGKGLFVSRVVDTDKNNFPVFECNYIDLETEQLYPVAQANEVIIEPTTGLVLLGTRIDMNTSAWKYWGMTEKKIIDTGEKGRFFDSGPSYVFSRDTERNTYYWDFDGVRLTKKYKVNYQGNLLQTAIGNYMVDYTPATGAELVRLGIDNIIPCPEIVEGPEGISLRSIFIFNNQVYVYAFTYTHGWQVWKMSKTDSSGILSTEENAALKFNVYPNPVRSILNIDTEQVFNYRIVDVTGRELMRGKLDTQKQLNLEALEKGLYIIQVYDEKTKYATKLIKE